MNMIAHAVLLVLALASTAVRAGEVARIEDGVLIVEKLGIRVPHVPEGVLPAEAWRLVNGEDEFLMLVQMDTHRARMITYDHQKFVRGENPWIEQEIPVFYAKPAAELSTI